jgi:DNA-binding transcriptional ArsR family regulator
MTLERTFAALGDPARRAIVDTLAHGPRTVHDLAHPFDISRPAISKHLRVLAAAGIVEHARRGREHWYALTPHALDEAGTWLDEITDTWRTALETLKRLAEEETHGNDQ